MKRISFWSSSFSLIIIFWLIVVSIVSSMKIENQSVNDKYRTTAAENSIRIQEKTPPPPNKGGKHHQIPIKIKLHGNIFVFYIWNSIIIIIFSTKVWFALFGWIACISSTILCARCTGDLWRDKKLFGIPLWYRLHQITAILGFICNSISIIVIVIQADGKLKTNIHAIIGYVSTILITIQAMTGFLKPDNQSDFRIIFNYIHWLIGTMAHSLALINILMSAIKKNKQFLWMFVSYLFIYLAFTDLLRKLDLNRLRSLSAKKIVLKTIAHYLSYFVLFIIFTLTIGMMIKIFD